MNSPDNLLAPGCFGLAMTYQPDARECGVCPFAASCAPIAAANLKVLREELGVKAPKPAPKAKATLKERAVALRAFVMPALAQRKNPFADKKPDFLRIAFHCLLKCRDGVMVEDLMGCLEVALKMNAGMSRSCVRQTVLFLETIEIGRCENNRIILN